MFRIIVNKAIRKLKLYTDDSAVRYLLEVVEKKTEFIPWQKKVGTITRVHRLYDEKRTPPLKDGYYTYTLGYGWAAYLINTFSSRLSKEDYTNIMHNVIYSPNYREMPFPELRDYQNDDVLHVLKYRIGLFSCYTSYGKIKNLPHCANYITVKHRAKTVKGETPNTVLRSRIANGLDPV